jgi:multidrug efflux pump subunit AcrA (membrane-fusion protein)
MRGPDRAALLCVPEASAETVMTRAHALLVGSLLLLLVFGGVARAAPTFTVQLSKVADEKAVFATVESRNVVPARARIGGTVSQLSVKQGDHVAQSQVIAVVTDPRLPLQIQSLDAQIAGLESQLAQAQIDLGRAQELAKTGAVSRETLDKAETAYRVASTALTARIAERAATREQLTEGRGAGTRCRPRA